MIRIFTVLVLPLFLIASDPTYLNEETSDYAFTSQESVAFSAVGFRISGGVIGVNALGGWADGEYILREANIEPTNVTNTFVADLIFAKKKGAFSYSHTEKIGILYDGFKLWIKYRDRIYRYSIPAPLQSIEQEHNRITTQTKAPILDVVIENMKLRFEF
jgi:hypothetical protein